MAKKQVAGYILEKRIGKGSYATVWKGRDDKQELVAIKVISRQTVTETAQLRQEVEVLRKISHPNIVRFRDLKKSTAHFYLVLEYCAGGDLSQFLRAKGRVQEETARRFLTQIASGLFVLHSSNHLHRDLKPQNILLSDCSVDPVLKLADFGFARALPEQDMAATVCGSPLYMAPEILRHEPYDAKADLWSVGAILYELLLGRTPFSGSNPLQLLANIETTALSFEGVQLSAPGQQFLRALLVHSPSQRLSSQAFMQHPYVSLSPPSVSLTQGAVSETSKDQPSPVADVQDTEGSFIVTEWIDKVPKSGAASPSAFCSPEESPRDAAEEAPGTGFITASSSAGSGYRGETGDTVKKVEELTASEVGVSKDVPASTGKVSPFLSEVINATARDTRKQAVGGSQAEVPEKKRNGNMDEDQYVVLASNTPTAFARGKGPTPAVAASSFCSNLTRIARTLEQLAMRLVEQAPVEALSLLLRALSLLEKALKVSLDDEQMGEPLRRDFTRTFAAAEKVERQLQSATLSCAEFCAVAQPNRAIFESAVQHAKDAAVVLSKGQEVVGFDVSPANLDRFAAAGGQPVESPLAVADLAKTVVTMLPAGSHVLEVYNGQDGLLSDGGAGNGSLLIDCSTCEPAIGKQVATLASQRGAATVDAPVSGGTPAAEQASLTFMVGGPEGAVKQAELILQHMGKKVIHCGDAGMGQAAKLCNNLVLGITMAGVCEGHALAGRFGLDQKKLAEILNISSGRCWSSELYNPCPGVMEGVPAARGYTGGFACDLIVKDLGLAANAALASKPKLGLPMGGLALQMYSQMSARGDGMKDFSGLYTHVAGEEKKS